MAGIIVMMQGVVGVASFRVGVALLALFALPMRYTGLQPHRWLFVAYLVWTVFLLLLVWRRLGGELRPLVGGIVDQALLTFTIHQVGSSATMLSALYLLSGTMNALVTSFRVGITLAVVGSTMFAGVVAAESVGWLAYAPAAPPWVKEHPPTLAQGLASGVLAAVVMMLSTLVVSRLVRALKARETELMSKNELLEELSQRDPLTQLYNRRHVLARIEVELTRVKRGHPLAVLMIDLDGFKHVNDDHGHLRGDLLLKEMASALAAGVRTSDIAGRFGGDEFVVALPDTPTEAARAVAERLTEILADVGRRFDAARPVTGSVGVATAHADDTVAALLHRADASSYGAKRGGGNRVVLAG